MRNFSNLRIFFSFFLIRVFKLRVFLIILLYNILQSTRKVYHTLQDNLSMLKILILYDIYRMEYEIKICRVFFFTIEIKLNRSKYFISLYLSHEFIF